MKILLSTNIKDEYNYREWILYHLKLGFTDIVLWDDGSEEPVVFDDPRVRIFVLHRKKKGYMEASLEKAREVGAEWLLHLDGDEYLYLGGRSIQDFLKESDHPELKAIVFPWLWFGSSGKNREIRGKVLTEYTRCHRKTSLYIKTMCRVRHVKEAQSAHTYIFLDDPKLYTQFAGESHQRIRYGSMYPEKCTKPHKGTICIAHFYYQSWDTFRRRRSRTRDDTEDVWHFPGLDLTQPIPNEGFHATYNDMEFPFLSDFFTG